MSESALSVRGLNKNFGALQVASNIDLQLMAGDRHALIGPNGAGKTTLVNLITGVLSPSSGAIELQGTDVTRLSQAARSRLGLARTYQINQLFQGLSVLDNVCLAIAERSGAAAAMIRPLGKRREIVDEAMQRLADFDLAGDALMQVGTLPYGRQRTVEIVIALSQQPKVLLLDEPAAGIPSAESRLILDVIDALPDDMCILIIEHDMDIVFRFAERITVLANGAVLAEGTPPEIAADQRVRSVYLGESLSR